MTAIRTGPKAPTALNVDLALKAFDWDAYNFAEVTKFTAAGLRVALLPFPWKTAGEAQHQYAHAADEAGVPGYIAAAGPDRPVDWVLIVLAAREAAGLERWMDTLRCAACGEIMGQDPEHGEP